MTFRPPPPRLRDLPDVTIGTLTGDDLLSYDQASGTWVNAPLGASRLGSMGVIPRPGTWTIPGNSTSKGGTGACHRNRVVVVPLWLAGRGTIDRFLIQVTTAAAGVTFTPVIYADDGAYYPAPLVAALPSIDMSTTGIKASSPPGGVFLRRGLYWIGGLATGGASNPSVTLSNGSRYGHALWGTTAFGNSAVDYLIDGTEGGSSIEGGSNSFLGGTDVMGYVAFGRTTVPDPFPAYTGRGGNPATNQVGTFNGLYPLTPIRWA
jgi:hypothetical protein